VHRPTPLPWRRPRRELLLLALVAAAALSPVYPINTQDVSRLCLTHALVNGRFTVDDCVSPYTVDKASYGGHYYSNKAPGMSLLEVPSAEAIGIPSPSAWQWEDLRLWGVRVLSSGLAFLACAFLVGRVCEGLAPGCGGLALVAFALGTLVAPFAVANFDHLPAAALGFAAFLLAWRGRPLAAGLAAGAAVLCEYEAAFVAVVVGAYVALRGGRQVYHYVRGALPGIALLWTYDWLAFGAPWHAAVHYTDNAVTEQQRGGLLGVHLPSARSTWLTLAGNRGLLVVTPVVAAAAYGLWLLWRRGLRAEALTCAVVFGGFLLGEFGYFDPYAGTSPGPRYLVASLPFLAVGLGPAFAQLRRVTLALAAVSVVATTASVLVWANVESTYRGTIWGELARVPAQLGRSRFVHALATNVVVWAGPGRELAAVLVAAAAAAAFATAAWSAR